VICKTKCIWSHYLLLDREKSIPDLALSLRTRAGPLQPIDATMQLCRTDYPAPWDWPAAPYNSRPRLTGFFNTLLERATVKHAQSHRWPPTRVLSR
jgi:hypothetical protein